MRKTWIIVISIILVFLVSIYIGIKISSSQGSADDVEIESIVDGLETIASEDEKISPNAILIQRTYYERCTHINEETETISSELVNINKQELQQKYPECQIEKFEKDEVILKKTIDEWCEEHFVLKDEKGYIVVYNIGENGEENIYLNTNITTEYLPATDKHALQKGLYMYGQEELNELLQDFE